MQSIPFESACIDDQLIPKLTRNVNENKDRKVVKKVANKTINELNKLEIKQCKARKLNDKLKD